MLCKQILSRSEREIRAKLYCRTVEVLVALVAGVYLLLLNEEDETSLSLSSASLWLDEAVSSASLRIPKRCIFYKGILHF